MSRALKQPAHGVDASGLLGKSSNFLNAESFLGQELAAKKVPSPNMKGKPNAVPCLLCNNQFFPASLRFHQKQCRKRQWFVSVSCPSCNFLVPEASLANHLRDCAAAAYAVDLGLDANDLPFPAASQHGTALCQPVGSRNSGDYHGDAEVERSQCPHCSRRFSADRIQRHMQICGNLRQARPRGPQGQVTQETDCVFDSSAARAAPPLERDHGFERPRKCCFIPRGLYDVQGGNVFKSPEASLIRRRNRLVNPEVWRRKRKEFLTAVRAARRKGPVSYPFSEDVQRVGVSHSLRQLATVACPYCARKFAPAIAERHIPKCLHTTNHARKTPSRFGDAVKETATRPPPLLAYRKREPEGESRSRNESQITPKGSPLNLGASIEHSRTMGPFRHDRRRRSRSPGAASPELQPSSLTVTAGFGVSGWQPAPKLSEVFAQSQRRRSRTYECDSSPSSSVSLRGSLPAACGERVLHALTWSSQTHSRNMGRRTHSRP